MNPTRSPSARTKIHRKPQRAHYDSATISAIIDEALLCHIAFQDGGSVHCLPMACWREGDHLYIHGASNSSALQNPVTHSLARITAIFPRSESPRI